MPASSSTTRTVAMARSLPARQVDGEAAALALVAADVDAAAVRLHDVADDGEAEAGGAGLRSLHERLEDARALCQRDAGAHGGEQRRVVAAVAPRTLQQLDAEAERRERRAQLVRQRRHELLAARLLVAQVRDVLQDEDQPGGRAVGRAPRRRPQHVEV